MKCSRHRRGKKRDTFAGAGNCLVPSSGSQPPSIYLPSHKSPFFLKIVSSHFPTPRPPSGDMAMGLCPERLHDRVLLGTFRPETVVGTLVSGHLTCYSTSAISMKQAWSYCLTDQGQINSRGHSPAHPDRSLGILSSLSSAVPDSQSRSCFLF